MLHTEVTTLVTRSRAAVAEAANRGELPRRIQFRGNLEFVANAPRHREWWVGWQKSEGIANLDRVTRQSPARGEVFADLEADCRRCIRSYNTSAPNREVDRREPSKCQVRFRTILSLTGRISSARYEYKKIEIADITRIVKIKRNTRHV